MNERSKAMDGRWRAAVLGLLALAAPPALPARADVAAQGAALNKGAAHSHGRRSHAQDRVATLAKALDLDANQQAALRNVLQPQREEARRIWSDESVPSAIRVARTKVLGKETAERIRALLNEEQRKKYGAAPQGDEGNAARNARVEDWMKGGTWKSARPASGSPRSESDGNGTRGVGS